ncbi:MAG: GNAT family N-acetyltransferase [Actinomycetota bacterium]|nr:GNAT family N-acetyltransferase [Actinomycetota bacterium]
MVTLADVDWPPVPLVTARLKLRATEAGDRAGYVELLTSEDVRRYLGGPMPRDEVVRSMPDVPGRYPGTFAIELAGQFAGAVMVERRSSVRPGHVRDGGNELEISFTLLPEHWGHGYASEAVEAVLEWAMDAFPDEPVMLCTQAANVRARRLAERFGFRHVETLNEFGAEQWLGVR